MHEKEVSRVQPSTRDRVHIDNANKTAYPGVQPRVILANACSFRTKMRLVASAIPQSPHMLGPTIHHHPPKKELSRKLATMKRNLIQIEKLSFRTLWKAYLNPFTERQKLNMQYREYVSGYNRQVLWRGETGHRTSLMRVSSKILFLCDAELRRSCILARARTPSRNLISNHLKNTTSV